MHPDGGRRKRVVGREKERPPVLAAFIGCCRGTGEDVVPFEDVGF